VPRQKTAAERNAEIMRSRPEPIDISAEPVQNWLSFYTIDGQQWSQPVRDVRIEPASAYFNSFSVSYEYDET
jgi:hypothetical protein